MREYLKRYFSFPSVVILFAFLGLCLLVETSAEEKNRQSPKMLKKFNFVGAGDFDCGDEPKRTVSGMMKINPEIVLALGDLSYRGSARCWLDTIAPLEKNADIKITFGRHDMGGNLTKYNAYLNHFNMTQPYYSFNYQDVHFLAMATGKNKVIPYIETSKQYEFVVDDLKRAHENKSINWIIVYTFRPFYSSNTTHPGLDELRDLYHPLFDKYGVDIVLQAHNHNYQRTYPLNYNQTRPSTPVMTDKETAKYSHDPKGPLFIIVGTGGRDLHNFTGQAPYVITQFQKHGFLNIDIDSSKKEYALSGTFYENGNMIKQDHFSIAKKKNSY
jgi:Calcineurin-like phosphoesterase